MGVNAIITEIDKTNKIITVKDNGEEDALGDTCLIACSGIPMIYCNYDTQDVISIDFQPYCKSLYADEIFWTVP